jgi:hypothetical protein
MEHPGLRQRIDANGYAALKEIDYHMNLNGVSDRFRQQYSPTIFVDTDEAPMDECVLISCRDNLGRISPEGYEQSLHRAVEYAMAFLEEQPGNGLSLRGMLSGNIALMMHQHRPHGANHYYSFFDTAQAEVPGVLADTRQAVDLLRAAFDPVPSERVRITAEQSLEFLDKVGLDVRQIMAEIGCRQPPMDLPRQHPREMARMLLDNHPVAQPWRQTLAHFREGGHQRREEAIEMLLQPLESLEIRSNSTENRLEKCFRELCRLCEDRSYGPWYVLSLLEDEQYGLMRMTDAGMDELNLLTQEQALYVAQLEHAAMDARQSLAQSNLFNSPQRYRILEMATADLIRAYGMMDLYHQLQKPVWRIRDALLRMSRDFFRPLCHTLDRIRETFRENDAYLNGPHSANWCGRQTEQLQSQFHLQSRVSQLIQTTDMHGCFRELIHTLLSKPDCWRRGDEPELSRLIIRFFTRRFPQENNRTLLDELDDLFPQGAGNAAQQAQILHTNLLPMLRGRVMQSIRFDPCFNRNQVQDILFLRTPGNCPNMWSLFPNPPVPLSPGIHAKRFGLLRFIQGVPLYACGDMERMKYSYEALRQRGAHLYSATGRGNSPDWAEYLPDLIPLSFARASGRTPDPKSLQAEALYHRGVEEGLIRRTPTGAWILVTEVEPMLWAWIRSHMEPLPTDSGGCFELEDAARRYLSLVDSGHFEKCLYLRGDPDPSREPERVDHFVRSPVQQTALRQALERLDKVRQILERLSRD